MDADLGQCAEEREERAEAAEEFISIENGRHHIDLAARVRNRTHPAWRVWPIEHHALTY